jgi:hypothetical protein
LKVILLLSCDFRNYTLDVLGRLNLRVVLVTKSCLLFLMTLLLLRLLLVLIPRSLPSQQQLLLVHTTTAAAAAAATTTTTNTANTITCTNSSHNRSQIPAVRTAKCLVLITSSQQITQFYHDVGHDTYVSGSRSGHDRQEMHLIFDQ